MVPRADCGDCADELPHDMFEEGGRVWLCAACVGTIHIMCGDVVLQLPLSFVCFASTSGGLFFMVVGVRWNLY